MGLFMVNVFTNGLNGKLPFLLISKTKKERKEIHKYIGMDNYMITLQKTASINWTNNSSKTQHELLVLRAFTSTSL